MAHKADNIAPTDAPPDTNWLHGAACVTSSRHAQKNSPCQDACLALSPPAFPRALVIAADGRGSAKESHRGARAAVRALRKAVRVLDRLLANCLDNPTASGAETDAQWRLVADVLLRWLMHEQMELASESNCDPREFDFTVALAIVGREHTGWIHVGDAGVAMMTDGAVALRALPQLGEFANETRFVHPSESTITSANTGTVRTSTIAAIAVFTDGIAARLFDVRRQALGAGMQQIIERLRAGTWNENRLRQHLEHPTWLQGGDDDRSLAYLVRPTPTVVTNSVSVATAGIPTAPHSNSPGGAHATTPSPQRALSKDLPPTTPPVADAPDVRFERKNIRRRKRRKGRQVECATPASLPLK